MITLIETLNYRCLRYIRQPLGSFHVLVGPNASGKTTFLDIIAFLGQLVSDGLDAAIENRTQNFQDLLWHRKGDKLELAIEALIPEETQKVLGHQNYTTIRYEIALEYEHNSKKVIISAETVLLKKTNLNTIDNEERTLFPILPDPPETILTSVHGRNTRTIVNKVSGGNDNFYSEIYKESGKGWAPSFKLGPRKSALGNLLDDESKFPASAWLKNFLVEGVQRFLLNSLLIRKASPPGKGQKFLPDGSNIPWVINNLQEKEPENFGEWIAHLQTALPDIENIHTIEREDDKHRYLMIGYRDGLKIPSWMVSDGTLRLLALTLPAYLSSFSGVYLIEEPENGIHPRAVETMFQSLSSVYGAQILLATHSPVILSLTKPANVLCFAKTEEGATDIVMGSNHPELRKWRGETNLGTLFASGVLG